MPHLHWANDSDAAVLFADSDVIVFLAPLVYFILFYLDIFQCSPAWCEEVALTEQEALNQDLLNHWSTLPGKGVQEFVCVNYQRKPSKKDKNNDDDKKEAELLFVALSMGVREDYKRSEVISWHRDSHENILQGLYLTLSLPVTVYSRTSEPPFIWLNFFNDSEFSVEPFFSFFWGKNINS